MKNGPMQNNDELRVFLESPVTNELVSELDMYTKERNKQPIRRKNSRKQSKLPPYIPFRNIYEETDLSKLTERQRLMVQKFQSASAQVSSLFVAVNDLNLKSVKPKRKIKKARVEKAKCTENCIRDARQLEEFLEWLLGKNINKRRLLMVMSQLKQLLTEERACICSSENKLYEAILKLLKSHPN